MIAPTPRIIVPLDFPDMLSAFGLAARLDPNLLPPRRSCRSRVPAASRAGK